MSNLKDKLYADLSAGHGADVLRAEFERVLNEANEQYQAELKAKQEQEMQARKGQAICDIAQRMLEGKLTAEDVSEVYMAYARTQLNASDDMLKEIFGPDTITKTVKTVKATLAIFEPLVEQYGLSWDQVMSYEKPAGNAREDNVIIRDFLNSLDV